MRCQTASTQQSERQNFGRLVPVHAEVNYNKFKTGIAHSLDSIFYEPEDETTSHIICDCEALVNERKLTSGIIFTALKQGPSGAYSNSGKRCSVRTWNQGLCKGN